MKIVAFDLDDTLAPSKSPLPPRMNTALQALLDRVEVCVISGAHFTQFDGQLLSQMTATEDELARLHLMPTCGTRYERYSNGKWSTVYSHALSEETRTHAKRIIEQTARELGLWEENPVGPIIEDRGSQLTFSALGQQARFEDKQAWDPSGEKRTRLRDAIAPQVPDLEVRSGGSTSIDMTEKGIDKAYGIRQLLEKTGYRDDELIFIGDRLDRSGNDYPVKAAGFQTIAVRNWEETVEIIERIIDDLDVGRDPFKRVDEHTQN
ncbi:MAG: HAD-IIB family hydrolase [Actinomycetaceae bacterium]|nr:HAD-IIB family hydrolase [Actinomycetaceae bacterium]